MFNTNDNDKNTDAADLFARLLAQRLMSDGGEKSVPPELAAIMSDDNDDSFEYFRDHVLTARHPEYDPSLFSQMEYPEDCEHCPLEGCPGRSAAFIPPAPSK